ncbi:hypothetical protein [Mesorhizobium sp. B2-1-3A]|uniref:COG3904 family protein n=1 Tax=Mesorhizobium sp. B2-1-3A TaxID=2589971 RepID=UPI00112E9473|nr:hypothetical protein [Mesorhizobium sp. B2-1-3A]TPM89692.1 hypothetical protein FJ977_35575 [Mesorhizobium sp. B2-1-3A]
MVPGRCFDGKAWRALVRLVLLVAVVFAVPPALAQEQSLDIPPMRFAVVRSNAPGCEPNCPEWISAEGTIDAGTPSLLKRTLKALKGRQLPVVVNSPGGNVDAAVTLGQMIRKNKLDIAVGTTVFSGCEPQMKNCRDNQGKGAEYFGMAYDSGAMCNSACPLMFSGGVRRVVGDFAYLGVHQVTTTYRREKLLYRTTYRIVNGKKKIISTKVVSRKNAGSYKTYEMSKAVEKRLSAYLQGMGIGEGVFTTMKNTPASEIHQLVLENMLRMNLVTSLDSVELFTGGAICKANPMPANCREIPADKEATPANLPTAQAKPTLAAPVEATTPKEADMRFVLVRGSNPLCNPDCPEWISAEGSITAQTPEKLRQALDAIAGRRLPIVINSQGGDVESALAAGRLIRERKLDVVVAHTDFADCDPSAECLAKDGVHSGLTIESESECASACPIMVAGGVRRFIGPAVRLSVSSVGLGDKVKAYLEEMAIGPGLFAAMQLSSSKRQLYQQAILKFGLATGPQSADELTGATICRSVPRPDNCRLVPSANAEADMPAKL